MIARQHEVLSHRKTKDEASPFPIFRDVGNAALINSARHGRERLALELNAAGLELPEPHDRLHQLVLTIALNAGHPHDFSRGDVEVELVHGALAAVVADA